VTQSKHGKSSQDWTALMDWRVSAVEFELNNVGMERKEPLELD
jgi:hypothetical protein